MRRVKLSEPQRFSTLGGGVATFTRAWSWSESTTFDGHNWISDATGSQWDHEDLYRTDRGRYVLHSWSQWQGSRPTWREVTLADAAQWIASCARAPMDLEAVDEELAEAVRGLSDDRPEPEVRDRVIKVRLTDAEHQRFARAADDRGLEPSVLARALLDLAVRDPSVCVLAKEEVAS